MYSLTCKLYQYYLSSNNPNESLAKLHEFCVYVLQAIIDGIPNFIIIRHFKFVRSFTLYLVIFFKKLQESIYMF